MQASIEAWFEASGDDAEREAIAEVNRRSMDFVTYIPTGFFLTSTAWRREVQGIAKAPFPIFWGVSKG